MKKIATLLPVKPYEEYNKQVVASLKKKNIDFKIRGRRNGNKVITVPEAWEPIALKVVQSIPRVPNFNV